MSIRWSKASIPRAACRLWPNSIASRLTWSIWTIWLERQNCCKTPECCPKQDIYMQNIKAIWLKLGRRDFRLPFQLKWTTLVLWGMAALIVVAVLVPIVYLVMRALGAGSDAWQGLLRFQTLQTIARTIWLSLAVTAASAAIAVPLA